MMKLKAVISNLLLIFAGLLFMLQANPLVEQKSTIKTGIDPQIGVDSKKGPPGIKTVDLVTRLRDCLNFILFDFSVHPKP